MPTNKPLVSLLIPTYNGASTILDTLSSAFQQDYPNLEIIVSDDGSYDYTAKLVNDFKVKLYVAEDNLGLGKNLTFLMQKAKGKFLVYLCQDDIFTNNHVISDMVSIFENDWRLGVLGRYYYQYFDGHKGPVMTIRSDIYISSCQPSGIMFRKEAMRGEFSNRLFVEMPSMIKNVLSSYWKGDILRYDTIAARLHNSNAATNASYFHFGVSQSQTLNWLEVCGKKFIYPMYFIQLKCRYPAMLKNEIKTCLRIEPKSIFNPWFVFCSVIALLLPGKLLVHLSRWYRNRICRMFVREITREDYYGKKI
jgi:glycosyltransferase involved in cell wall biosynthesis